MCRALDEMFEESTNKGIQMGIKQGIEQGIEQGIALNQFEVYQTMLDKGFSVKTIASIFSVSEYSTHSEPHRPALRATRSIM